MATVLLPGAAAAYLFALPFVDRAKSRAVRSRWSVLTGVGLMMAGVTALTAVAIVEDGNNESFQHGVEQAHAEATRARELAREGVSPVGGVAVFDNDPEQKTRNLFKEHCASCHTLEGKGAEEAPVLDGFTNREWLAALVRNPRDKRFYGATKHNTMEPLTTEAASDEEIGRGGGIPDQPVRRERGGERGRGDGRPRQRALGQETRVLVVPRARGRQGQHGADAGRSGRRPGSRGSSTTVDRKICTAIPRRCRSSPES